MANPGQSFYRGYQGAGGSISSNTSGMRGQRNLTVTAAVISGAIVAYDLKTASADRQAVVRALGATALLWGLIFVLGEVSPELGSSVAVFVLLVFLIARHGAVAALLGAFNQPSGSPPASPASSSSMASDAQDQVAARGARGGQPASGSVFGF